MTCRLLGTSFRAGPTRFSYTGLLSQAMKATEPNAKGKLRTHLKPGPVFVGAASPKSHMSAASSKQANAGIMVR